MAFFQNVDLNNYSPFELALFDEINLNANLSLTQHIWIESNNNILL